MVARGNKQRGGHHHHLGAGLAVDAGDLLERLLHRVDAVAGVDHRLAHYLESGEAFLKGEFGCLRVEEQRGRRGVAPSPDECNEHRTTRGQHHDRRGE